MQPRRISIRRRHRANKRGNLLRAIKIRIYNLNFAQRIFYTFPILVQPTQQQKQPYALGHSFRTHQMALNNLPKIPLNLRPTPRIK